MKIYWILIALLLTTCSCKKGNSDIIQNTTNEEGVIPAIKFEISGGYEKYVYAPSAIEDEDGIRYVFVCENKDPGIIRDHVYLYKGTPDLSGNYLWDTGKEVLAPSDSGWDCIHTCDPDVRAFKLTYKGETYNWIMTYLGCDQLDNNHNQIGLAFAKNIDGPYVKYDQNPLIPTTSGFNQWGVGQSTTVVLDSTSIQLFYTSSPFNILVRHITQLNDLDKVDIGTPEIVTNITPNAYFSFSKKYIYGVYEKNVEVNDGLPTGDYCYFMYKPISAGLFSVTNDWKSIGQIGPSNTKFPHNHNPGLLTDKKGYMLSDDEATVYFTVGESGNNWLWSYQLYSAKFDLKKLVN